MKFGETFMEYLHGDQERFLDNCCHVEYKRLKKVLKSCKRCRALKGPFHNNDDDDNNNAEQTDENQPLSPQFCQVDPCPLCDQTFFSELMREASGIAGCFRSRVRHLLHLHVPRGMQKYLLHAFQCFSIDKQVMAQEGRMLIEYVMMNAIAIRKILKKYDKVHCSANGRNFKTKLRAEHIEILQSPWLIELGAFYMNFNESNSLNSNKYFSPFSCDFSSVRPAMTLMLPDDVKLDYDLTCPVCLETVFNPYALSCGHLFCKSCVCLAASVMIVEGPKSADSEARCPVCREAGVYVNAVHMMELDMLVKTRCIEYWKERLNAERAAMVKQSKEFWDLQTKFMLGY